MKSTKVPHSKTKPAVLISTYPTKKNPLDYHASLWMESMLEARMEYTYLQNPR